MKFLKTVTWIVLGLAIILLSMYLTGNYELLDYLKEAFLAWQPYLPLRVTFERFLVVVTGASLLVVVLVVLGGVVTLLIIGGRLSLARQQRLSQIAASAHELRHLATQRATQYAQLIEVASTLATRLDKRVIVQHLVQVASQLTSMPQANSVVSLWLVQFETDTLRFETGHYCDEMLFTQTVFQLNEAPFAKVVQSQQAWQASRWQEGISMVREERGELLKTVSGVLMVPLVIENSVLGVLLIFCHPDVLKGYDAQRTFYDAMWGELSLGLAIAIQGELAILDRLTGVHSRAYLMKRLLQEVERSNRYQVPLALLMIDIDNFKAVNDTLGHLQGDAVLKIVAKLIRKEIRAIDLAGRYGGEEFIVVFPETGLGEGDAAGVGAVTVAERIRRTIEQEFSGLQPPLNITISLGVAVRRFPQDRAMEANELIRLADEQLLQAKLTGKNRVCIATPGVSRAS